jgi:hypothetical protein
VIPPSVQAMWSTPSVALGRDRDPKALSSSSWFEMSIKAYISVTSQRRLRTVRATYSSKRLVASRSRSYRLVSGNGGNQDSRRMIQLS